MCRHCCLVGMHSARWYFHDLLTRTLLILFLVTEICRNWATYPWHHLSCYAIKNIIVTVILSSNKLNPSLSSATGSKISYRFTLSPCLKFPVDLPDVINCPMYLFAAARFHFLLSTNWHIFTHLEQLICLSWPALFSQVWNITLKETMPISQAE